MKVIPLVASLLLSTGIYAAENKSYQCSWHEKNVDLFQAKFKEFKYSEKGMFYYYISNDQNNVYINLRIFDDNIKNLILRSGLTIWINTDGKKDTRLGIKFPAGHRDMRNDKPSGSLEKYPPQKDRDKAGDQNISRKINESSENAINSLLLIGFDSSGPILISTSEEGNFRGAIYSGKDNYLNYELVLPFSKLPSINQNPKKKKQSLVLGLSHEYAKSSAMQGGGMPGYKGMHGGGMHGAGGGMHSGGRHEGGMNRGSGGYHGSEMHTPGSGSEQSDITWIKNIKLADEIK
jgi:hypothetical protein